MSAVKLLAFCDSPTVFTGFATVSRNLLQRWRPRCERISVWGINYSGYPHKLPYDLYPAGYAEWPSREKLSAFLNLIDSKDFTHCWLLHDTHNFPNDFAKYLRQVCDRKGIKLIHYFPIDGPILREWLEMPAMADLAVTYTEWGRNLVREAKPTLDPKIVPHGVDTVSFFPKEDHQSIRERVFNGWAKEDDFLMINVNRNERRKAPHHSLALLKELLKRGVRAKLVLHMPKVCTDEGTDLEIVARQMGLKPMDSEGNGVWHCTDSLFFKNNPLATVEGLNDLYNAADMVLSTSLGEGWGLSLVEGASAGCYIAAPDHSGCAEIGSRVREMGQENFISLPVNTDLPIINMYDLARIRYPIDIPKSADMIAEVAKQPRKRHVMNDKVREWLSWDRIADEFFNLMTK